MASDSAVLRVFGIDELLESILIYMSIDRLLLLKRVCSDWKRVISSSPSLQKIMFLRPAILRSVREHNPLFEDYFKVIGYAEDARSSARLEISPNVMRRLLHHYPKSWREMTMFQPPAPYWLIMNSASIFDITVKFLNDANVPIMKAVEKANLTMELKAEKKRKARSSLDHALRGGFARVQGGTLLKEGETLKRQRGDVDGPVDGIPVRRRILEVAGTSAG